MNVMDCVSDIRMEYYDNRLKTFDIYPKQMLPDKYQLARAGLFYTGKSDICQCFRCHVKLSAWKRDDDAMKEHFKWSNNCEYINIIGVPQQGLGFTSNTGEHSTGFVSGTSKSSFGSGSTTGANLFVRRITDK